MENKILTGKNIVKSFGEGEEKRVVLEQVSLEVEKGEMIAVMGPSGSGKSTLLFCMSGMDTVDAGQITFNGRELSACSENELSDIRRNRIGFVFQQPSLLKNLNILDNIILTAVRSNPKDVDAIVKRAKTLMEKTGIAELAERNITKASGGQLQRAGICRALMNQPEIIFGDEPTGALNSQAEQEIMELFQTINQEGTAVMLVTHSAKIAERTQRVVFMSDGQIKSECKLGKYTGKNLEERLATITAKMQELGI